MPPVQQSEEMKRGPECRLGGQEDQEGKLLELQLAVAFVMKSGSCFLEAKTVCAHTEKERREYQLQKMQFSSLLLPFPCSFIAEER